MSDQETAMAQAGRLVELFLNAVGDIPRFFEWDRARRRATVVFVYAHGLILDDLDGRVARTRQLAEEVVDWVRLP
ncbi:hypothetical protein ACFRU3_40715 [Streptomyces sp. NPDC056910]|uniref:hypothetical protein n=1 Tax=Streptomyces sp. NPDC056910 TaxID=3345964 RepID=UPI0036789063